MNGQMAMNLGAGLLMDAPFDDSDDLILTAIVIKNIPFAVRKEQIVQLMTEMALPLPYAFNYHFDSGVFRGLAFANFTTPDETHVVIGSLNGFDIQGRKLRVEYKKMLPLHERERIERLKRERRGQLEEQHRPIGQPPSMMTLNHQPSLASMASMSSIPDSSGQNPQAGQPSESMMLLICKSRSPADMMDTDMNDPDELRNYLALLELSRDPNHEDIILDSSLTPMQRRKIHEMAHYLGLQHMSYGKPNDRRIHISHANNQQPLGQNGLHPMVYPQHQIPTVRPGDGRRQLTNRAVTFEYNASEPGGAPRGPSSLLDIPGSPANGVLNMASNLRGAKSVADLRSYSPSPAPSAASYCMNVPLKDVNGATTNNERSGPSTVTAGTPQHTGSTSSLLLRRGDEERMIGAIGSLHLNTTGNAFGVGANSAASSESRSARGAFNFGGGSETQPPIGTAIGSSRTVGRAFGTDYKSHSATAAARSPGFPQPSRFGTSLANGSASARGILTNGSTMHGRHPSSSPESHHD